VRFPFLLCACVALLTAPCAAQSMADGQAIRRSTRDALLMMTNLDFTRADLVCAALKAEHPDAPHAPLLESYRLFWRFYLGGDEKGRTAELQAAVQRLITACNRIDPRYEQDRLLFLSCAHFFLAAMQKERGHAWEALLETRAMTLAAGELLRRDPGCIDARFIMGATAANLRPAPVPTADLERGAEAGYYLSPIARFTLARALADRNKNYAAAVPILQGLTEEFPGNIQLIFDLAQTYRRMGRPAEALAAYRRVLEWRRTDLPATYLLCRSRFSAGQVLERDGRYGEATSEYEDALRMADPRDAATAWFVPWSRLQIGKCLARTGQPDQALLHLEKITPEEDRDAYRQAQRLAGEIRKRGAGSR
jgi:tetratricopeptide (TPR) repeat protein